MQAFSFASLIALSCMIHLMGAITVVPKPGSPFRQMSDSDADGLDGSDSPIVLDARDAVLEVANAVVAPDGFSRSAALAGGTFPGPVIKAQKGQDFSIKVINNLDDPTMELTTTIHWHGIFQNGTNWADGVSLVTQCPIQPGESFRYRFNARYQTGTYWYHSHHETQYCDGLRGPLIIYDPEDPLAHLYDVDDENTIITLADWWHIPAHNVQAPFFPDVTTINGKGRYSGGPKTPLSVINVQHGNRYRFRIIGASCDAWHNFTIDGHRMTIIEADGVEVIPTEVDWIQILAGQRYSVVVDADRPVDNYWIRALPNHGNTTFVDGQNSAVLRYAGAPKSDPTTVQDPVITHFDENNLHPLHQTPAPGIPELGKADVVLHLVPGSINGSFTVNGVRFQPPPIPLLLQILSGARHSTDLLPSGAVYELPKNKVIEVHMAANDLTPGGARGSPHGIHLHGHNFHVIRTSTTSTPNFVNPLQRDVISLGTQAQNSNITFRFVTDNPGPWILHCHIDFHFTNGFAVVMAEAPDETAVQQSSVVPGSWEDLCPVPVQDAAALFNDTGHFDVTSLTTAEDDLGLTAPGQPVTPSLFASFNSTGPQTFVGLTAPGQAVTPSVAGGFNSTGPQTVTPPGQAVTPSVAGGFNSTGPQTAANVSPTTTAAVPET